MNWEKAKEFIGGLSILTRQCYDPWGPYTHAVHETGFFKRVIGGFNFWGMKKPMKWTGIVIEVPTHEWVEAKPKTCEKIKCANKLWHDHKISSIEKFVDFPDMESAMKHYSSKIEELYPLAHRRRHLAPWFFEGLQSGKPFRWATDPHYFDSLKRLHAEISVDNEHRELMRPRIADFVKALRESGNFKEEANG